MNINELHADVMESPSLREAIAAAIQIGKFIIRERLDRGDGWLPEGTNANRRQLMIYVGCADLWRDTRDVFAANVAGPMWERIAEIDVDHDAGAAAQESVAAHAAVHELMAKRITTFAERLEVFGLRTLAAIRLERALFRREARTP